MSELKPCPWCGQLPEVEWLAGFECVRHENSECPICPVLGWSLCVWQTRAAPVDGWTRVQDGVPTERLSLEHLCVALLAVCGTDVMQKVLERQRETMAFGRWCVEVGSWGGDSVNRGRHGRQPSRRRLVSR